MIRGVGVALLSSFLLVAVASGGNALIPYVGTVKALDPATKTFTIVGPDGKELSVTLTGMLLEEGTGPFRGEKFEDALKYVGRRIGVRLEDEKTAHLASIMAEGDLLIMKGQISRVDADESQIHFRSDGYTAFYRPTVNMAARSIKDGPLEDPSWEWFEARVDKPYQIKLGRFAGLYVIWSIEPWDPKEDEVKEGAKDEAPPAKP